MNEILDKLAIKPLLFAEKQSSLNVKAGNPY